MRENEQSPDIPPRLADGLRRAYRAEGPDVPLDWARAEQRPRGGLKPAWMGAAAVVMLAGSITLVLLRTPTRPAHDLNGDGVVDVLDAIRLANDIRDGSGAEDVNADGLVDEADVGAVLDLVVRLDGDGQ